MPHDAMHDILEGIAPLEIKLLLSYFISQKLFKLREYNDRLVNFNYGYSERDQPVPILNDVLHDANKSLRSSASQMLTLLRILPFLIADKIPEGEEHWNCFLMSRKIVDIILCPVISEGHCSSLKLLIRDHHTKFVELYGSSAYIPKLHFLVHYPDQIKAMGPVVRAMTTRHEAKLNFFKKASRLINFKNVAYSLACRHQRYMCYELSSGELLKSSLECGPPRNGGGVNYIKDETKNMQDRLVEIIPQISLECLIFRPSWVRQNGTQYQNNNRFRWTRSYF